jgi:hypothetical protein
MRTIKLYKLNADFILFYFAGCQQLRAHLARSQARREYQERRKALLKYIPDVSNSLAIVVGKISEREGSSIQRPMPMETKRILSLFSEGKLDKGVIQNALEKTVHQLEGETIAPTEGDEESLHNATGTSSGSKVAGANSAKDFSLNSFSKDDILHRLEKLKEIVPVETCAEASAAFALRGNQKPIVNNDSMAVEGAVASTPSKVEGESGKLIDLSNSPPPQTGPRWYSLVGIDVKLWC